jgi:hypothetical protein
MQGSIAELVVKAVRSLPEADQDRFLVGLLSLSSPEVEALRWTQPPHVLFSDPAPYGLGGPPMGAPGSAAMLPVRLPPELHDRFRRWSTDHGFSMAGVVRGLVERFLDEQAGTVERRKRATGKPSAKGAGAKPSAKRAAAKPSAAKRAGAKPSAKRARPTAGG